MADEILELTISAMGRLSERSGTGIAGDRSCMEGDCSCMEGDCSCIEGDCLCRPGDCSCAVETGDLISSSSAPLRYASTLAGRSKALFLKARLAAEGR